MNRPSLLLFARSIVVVAAFIILPKFFWRWVFSGARHCD